MTPSLLLFAWGSAVWTLLSLVVFLVSILLVVLILIQDSKDTGLTSAFGGGGGGSALLGARMQKDLAKMTAILGIVLAVSLIIMGFITSGEKRRSKLDDAAAAAATTAKESGKTESGDSLIAPVDS